MEAVVIDGNGIDYAEEMGLDMTTDTYDKGVHLNVYGAEKCSRFLGEILRKIEPPSLTEEAQRSSRVCPS